MFIHLIWMWFVDYGLRWLAKTYFNTLIAKSLSNSRANKQEKLHLQQRLYDLHFSNSVSSKKGKSG